MTELDMKKAVEFCERMEANGGVCMGECGCCPGYMHYNDGVPCRKNGWVLNGSIGHKSEHLVESCKRWLKENVKKEENTVLEFEGMSYEDAQTLQPGDRVKVLMKWPSGSYCPRSGKKWAVRWDTEMDKYVGETVDVDTVHDDGSVSIVTTESMNWAFPWFTLKPVERAPKKVTMSEAVALCEEKLGCRVEIVEESEAD